MGRFDNILMTADFDRTFTDPGTNIPQANIDAADEFMREGGLFTINTGRSIPIFTKFKDSVRVNAPIIFYNGAAVYDMDKKVLVESCEIPGGMDILREVLRDFPALWTEIQGVDAHYLYGENQLRQEFLDYYLTPYKIIKPEETPRPIIKFAFYGRYYDNTVSQFFSGPDEEIEYFRCAAQELSFRYGEVCEVSLAMPRIIDMQSKEAGKGRAARRMANSLGREILVAVGDSFNDLNMLQEADWSFIPSDCSEAIKELGFTETWPCTRGSIAGALEELKKIF